MTLLLGLFACMTAPEPCGEGNGRADDGHCYPLADTQPDSGADDTGGDDTDSGDTDSGDTDSGSGGDPVKVSGTFTYTGEILGGAVCMLSAWDPASILATGVPDYAQYSSYAMTPITCPTESGVGVAYGGGLAIGSEPIEIVVVGFIDADGSPDTMTDVAEGASEAGPFEATPGGEYDGKDIVLP